MFHVVFLCKKRDDMTQAAFTDYWINLHTPLTAKTPGLVGYRCYPSIGHPDKQPPFDAVAVCSFTDRAAYDAAMAGPEFQAALADAVHFQNTEETVAFWATEHIIVDR
jgi:uncharacterized protein (TIGR02118 family)